MTVARGLTVPVAHISNHGEAGCARSAVVLARAFGAACIAPGAEKNPREVIIPPVVGREAFEAAFGVHRIQDFAVHSSTGYSVQDTAKYYEDIHDYHY